MNPDGSEQTRISLNPAHNSDARWSPDGSKIVFKSQRDGNFEIYTMNNDGSGVTRITTNPADDMYPAWSPDVSKIAFSSNRDGNYDIFLMNTDGSNLIRLTNNPADDNEPAWSPDNKKIVFKSNRDGNDEIYIINADGTGESRITTNQADDFQPAWSPDGSKIAFTTNRDGTWTFNIYSMNTDGTGLSRLTLENDGEPAWSPDGSKIVFQSWRNNAIPQIYTMNPDGSEQTRITFNPAADANPSWGPDALTNVPLNIKIVPKTINLGSKGYFLAFVRLPEAYKDASIDIKTVSCSGAPAVRMMKMKIFPRMVGFVFKTSDLKGVEPGKRAILSVKGELKNKGTAYTFTGADSVKLIRKPRWQPDDIKDVSKVSDDQLFKQYST